LRSRRFCGIVNQRASGSLTREARLILYDVQAKAVNAAFSGDSSPLGSNVSYDTFELA
jgi:hypothetical protein